MNFVGRQYGEEKAVVVEKKEPKNVKPLLPEYAVRAIKALDRLYEEADLDQITSEDYDRIKRGIIQRVCGTVAVLACSRCSSLRWRITSNLALPDCRSRLLAILFNTHFRLFDDSVRDGYSAVFQLQPIHSQIKDFAEVRIGDVNFYAVD